TAKLPFASFDVSTANHKDDRLTAFSRNIKKIVETREYHTPDAVTLLKLGTLAGAEDRLRLDYTYSATSNNGNLLSHVVHQGSQTWTQKFSYDPLNRVQNFCEVTSGDCDPASPSAWGQKYDYDRFGNRWVTASSLAPDIHEPTV